LTSYSPNVMSGDPFSITGDNASSGEDGIMVDDPSWGGSGPGSIRILSITDGTSNTILCGESSTFDPNWPQYAPLLNPYFWPDAPLCSYNSHWSWVDQYPGTNHLGVGYYPLNSLLPPNPADYSTAENNLYIRSWTYGSGHPQGANFVFCDGSVHFLS